MSTIKRSGTEAPAFLQDLPIWLVWRSEYAENGGKPRKVPYYIAGHRRSGVQGAESDIRQLVTFREAISAAEEGGYAGVGIATTGQYGFSVVDFDDCVTEGWVIHPDVLRTTAGTYAEYSPSGNGVHVFILGDSGDRKDTAKDGKWGIELFNTKGFLTFTGNRIGGTEELSEANSDMSDIIASRFPVRPAFIPTHHSIDTIGMPLSSLSAAMATIDPDSDYHVWVKVGMAIHHETDGSEEGFLLWDTWSSGGTKYASEELNRRKWESFGNGGGGAPVTGKSLIKLSGYVEPLAFSPIIDLSPVPELVRTQHFNIRTASEFVAQLKPSSWLIRDVIPRAGLGVIYGASGAGKSFFTLEVCATFARALPWNGHKSSKNGGRVLYIAAEGVSGFGNRLKAYCKANDFPVENLAIDVISDAVPNLMDVKSVSTLVAEIKQVPKYDLIIMDTFAQMTSGANENSGEDIGKALGYCKSIYEATGAMVMLIHHSGKDASKGARGWSGLHAACDVVISISNDFETRVATVVKQKDGEAGIEFGFDLIPVALGEDEDGDLISSCVVRYVPIVKGNGKNLKLGDMQRAVRDVMTDMTGSWVTVDHVIDLCTEAIKEGDETVKVRKDNIRRAIRSSIGVFLEQQKSGEIRYISE